MPSEMESNNAKVHHHQSSPSLGNGHENLSYDSALLEARDRQKLNFDSN